MLPSLQFSCEVAKRSKVPIKFNRAVAFFVPQTSMKSSCLFAVLAVLLLLSSFNEAYCQDYIEYQIEINGDNSASWSIVQKTDVNAAVDDWEGFQQRIFTLVEGAVSVTNREMAIEPETIQMETIITRETQAKTTEFRFKWLNFSTSEGDEVVFGDIFKVPFFFTGLYGDGRLQINYTVGYSVMEVSPTADTQDNDSRTLVWYRTQDFLNGKPNITLASDSSSLGDGWWMQYAIIGLILVGATVASLVGFYLVRRRRLTVRPSEASPGRFTLESDEEKIMSFIRSSGGSVHQSRIVEQFGFSKAKTSQLLTSLEKKGVVARYKRGRDKIVNLIERTAGDKS